MLPGIALSASAYDQESLELETPRIHYKVRYFLIQKSSFRAAIIFPLFCTSSIFMRPWYLEQTTDKFSF